MPRKSLPSKLKNLSTVDVLVTKTSEEDLWTTFLSGVEEVTQTMEKWYGVANEVMDSYMYGNPFDNENYHHRWRNENKHNRGWLGLDYDFGRPHKEGKWWDSLRHEEQEDYVNSISRQMDFEQMGYTLKWQGRPEYDAFVEIRKRTKLPSSFDADLKFYENKRFQEAFEAWKKTDAEWVGHHTSLQKCIADCSFCAIQKKEREEREARYAELMKKEEQEQMEREERERSREKQDREEWERRKRISPVRYTCEVCEFSTIHDEFYKQHCKTAEHLRKEKHNSWFCVPCNHQCRSQVEHLNHLTTKKHKIAIGETEKDPDVFVCETCSFSTPTKQVYKVHCQSKKHLIAVGEVETQQNQYMCLHCGYSTNNQQHYNVHCVSKKHLAKVATTN